MKRKTYRITINDEHVDTRHAWNAARRAIAGLIRARLNDGERAQMKDGSYRHSSDGSLSQGTELWITDSGLVFNVKIEKVVDIENE